MRRIDIIYQRALDALLRDIRTKKEEGKDLAALRLDSVRVWLNAYRAGEDVPKEVKDLFAEAVEKFLDAEEKSRKRVQAYRKKNKGKKDRSCTWIEKDKKSLGFDITRLITKQLAEAPDEKPSLDIAFYEYIESLEKNTGRIVTYGAASREYHRQAAHYNKYVKEPEKGKPYIANPEIMKLARKEND